MNLQKRKPRTQRACDSTTAASEKGNALLLALLFFAHRRASGTGCVDRAVRRRAEIFSCYSVMATFEGVAPQSGSQPVDRNRAGKAIAASAAHPLT